MEIDKDDWMLLGELIRNARLCSRKRRNTVRYKMVWIPMREDGQIDRDELRYMLEKNALESERQRLKVKERLGK